MSKLVRDDEYFVYDKAQKVSISGKVHAMHVVEHGPNGVVDALCFSRLDAEFIARKLNERAELRRGEGIEG